MVAVVSEHLAKLNQRYLALGFLAAVVVAVLLATVWPIWSLNASLDSRIGRIQERLHGLKEGAATDEALQPRLEELRRQHLENGHYLKSGTEAMAAAEMQRILKHIARSSGTQVLSTQILPARQENGFVRVALKARVRGELPGIVDAIFTIESSNRFLFLDNVSVRQGTRRRKAGVNMATQFEGDFELFGYMPVRHDES